jgi:hypothetical protein
MMDKLSKSQIKALLNDQRFDGIVKFYQEFKQKVQDENVIGNSEFETLRNVFIKEGKLIGLKDFFDLLDQQVI